MPRRKTKEGGDELSTKIAGSPHGLPSSSVALSFSQMLEPLLLLASNCMGFLRWQVILPNKWADLIKFWAILVKFNGPFWLGYFGWVILVEIFSHFVLTHMFGPKKWAWVPRLLSNLEPPFLGPSMGLMTTYYHPYQNPLKQAPGI
ncbi:unnamed protein product [Prunus brigantina]